MLKGGNILDPNGKLIYPDPFPSASACAGCGNKITPTGAFLGAEMDELPTKCSDCGGKVKPKPKPDSEQAGKAGKKGFWGLFGKS